VGIVYIIPMARYRPDVITPEALRSSRAYRQKANLCRNHAPLPLVPQYVWVIMGAFDSLAGVMQSLSDLAA